jgi:hypothetical protein
MTPKSKKKRRSYNETRKTETLQTATKKQYKETRETETL